MPTATQPLIAYHGKTAVKRKYLNRVKKHREADQLVQAFGYWNADEKRGCAVGCCVHVDCSPHQHYESELGIPEQPAAPRKSHPPSARCAAAKLWPERFLSAIEPGADLSRVYHQFAAWLLSESGLLTITDGNRGEIEGVAALHRRAASGESVSDSEWSAAARSAWSAAWSAWLQMADKLIELLSAAGKAGT